MNTLLCVDDFHYSFNEILTGDKIFERCCVILTTFQKFAYHQGISHTENRMLFFENIENMITTLNSFQFIPTVALYLDHVLLFKDLVLPHLKREIVLVCHNGDLEFNDVDICNSMFIKKVYSQNLNIIHEKARALPIGLRNRMFGQNNIEKISLLRKQPLDKIKKKVFICMDFNSHPVRKELKYYLDWNDIPYYSDLEYRDYLVKMNECEFVLAPQGNGIDTHRFWEAIYLKCIPIFIENESNKNFYQNLRKSGYFFLSFKTPNDIFTYLDTL